MDKLSCNLNESGIVGDIGGILFNHLCYADDLCLVSLFTSCFIIDAGISSYPAAEFDSDEITDIVS